MTLPTTLETNEIMDHANQLSELGRKLDDLGAGQLARKIWHHCSSIRAMAALAASRTARAEHILETDY